jgi:hypothetical protein
VIGHVDGGKPDSSGTVSIIGRTPLRTLNASVSSESREVPGGVADDRLRAADQRRRRNCDRIHRGADDQQLPARPQAPEHGG